MKYLKFSILFVLVMGFMVFKSQAQVKDQSVHVKTIKKGKYITYEVGAGLKEGTYFYGRKNDYPLEVTEISPEKNMPQKHSLIRIKLGSSINERPHIYLPENMGFPVVYKGIGYEGNTKIQKQYGYVPMKSRSSDGYIFLDGIVYKVTAEGDNLNVRYVFVHEDFLNNDSNGKDEKQKGKKKKMSLKERMKALKNKMTSVMMDAGGKKLDNMKAVEKVTEYYKQAVAKKKVEYPKWEKSAKGAAYLKDMKAKKELIYNYINKQRMVIFANKTGKDIFVYSGESTKAGRLSAGTSARYICGSDYYYDFDGKRWYYPNQVRQITVRGDGKVCGTTITIK